MELALLANKFNVKGRLVTLVPFGNGMKYAADNNLVLVGMHLPPLKAEDFK